jgi:anaerobic selenocysteine-containing dehydrogenase
MARIEIPPGDKSETSIHQTFCRWCSALCGVLVTVSDGEIVSVRGDPEHPLSRGYTCSKGRALGEWHRHPQRLTQPLIRRGGNEQVVEPMAAVRDVAQLIREAVDRVGPDAVGIYHGTAAFCDAARGVGDALISALGSKSRYTSLTIDCASKPLVSELMSGQRVIPIIDDECAKLVLLIGTNPVVSHGQNLGWPDPIVRLRRFASVGEVWVVDPRRTETARMATRHLAIRPGTDDALLAWLVRELLDDGADVEYLDRHASQVDVLRAAVEPFSLERVSDTCDLDRQDLLDLLAAVRRAGRIAAMTGTGTSMGPTANTTEWLTWALMIVTGSYDQPGGMWFNPGYFAQLDRKALSPSDGSPEAGAPSRPEFPRRNDQWPCAAMVDEIEAGRLRVLFVVGGNPATAFPQPTRLANAFRKLDALVVLDVVENQTEAQATHVLPCPNQLERADLPRWLDLMRPAVFGQYTPAVVEPPGECRPVWWYFGQIGRILGFDLLPGGLDPDQATDDDILRPIADASRTSFETLKASPVGHVSDTSVFGWVHKILPDGRWRLAPSELVAQLAAARRDAGLLLIPRRQGRHVNSGNADIGAGGTRDMPEILINSHDATRLEIQDRSRVEVVSGAGSVFGVAKVTDDIRSGAVSVPHGFSEPCVSDLISNEEGLDPLTGMTLQSGVPVVVRKS